MSVIFEMAPIWNRKDGSILLYVIFVSVFLLAFFATFRSDVASSIADSVSRSKAGKNLTLLSDGIGKIGSDPSSGLEVRGSYAFVSDSYDGRIFTGSAFSGSPLEIAVTASGGASVFEVFVVSGAGVSVESFDSERNSVDFRSVAPRTFDEVSYPSGTGSIEIRSLGGYSLVEVDRLGGKLDYPSFPVRAMKKYGPIFEYVGTYRTK